MSTIGGGVTVFILSCKRFDLYTRTVSSFIKCCLDRDLITRWITIDDSSHPTDRLIMKSLYPFMEWIDKTPEEQGHAKSLNMARNVITTPYAITLEDDWLFVKPLNYITRSLAIFERENDSVAQVLFNRHYIEIPDDVYLSVTGGILKHDGGGNRYFLHEYVDSQDTKRQAEYKKAHPINFGHLAHFALRPGFFKTSMWTQCGKYNEDTSAGVDFESDYVKAYHKAGLQSTYFDGVYCLHIGRLNRDKFNPNAPPNA